MSRKKEENVNFISTSEGVKNCYCTLLIVDFIAVSSLHLESHTTSCQASRLAGASTQIEDGMSPPSIVLPINLWIWFVIPILISLGLINQKDTS